MTYRLFPLRAAGSAPGTPGSAGGPPEFSREADPANLTPTLRLLLAGNTLSADETTHAFEAIMTGQASHSEVGALLALLAVRTPTAEEILGAARVMRDHVDRLTSSADPTTIVDTAGTGGAPKTYNVSTAAAIIAAAAGAIVAKHGNRSRTGRGSAEVLRQLGVNVDADRPVQARCLQEAGVCFCFAIHHHPAAKHAMPVRMALGFPTIFNLLGPLTNPAGARRQVMGVYESRFLRPIADALLALDAIDAMVVHSEDGLDEVSISAPTNVMRVRDGAVSEEQISPAELGLQLAPRDKVQAGDLDDAARLVRGVLDGSITGPLRDMALLNTAATLVVADIAPSMQEGVTLAGQTIDEGKAISTLQQLVTLSNG